MSDFDRIWRPWWRHLALTTERHPYWSDAQIAACANRRSGMAMKFHPRHVEAARIFLGARFPEDASRDSRKWLLYAVAQLMGLRSHTEHGFYDGARRGFADVFVKANTGRSLVIEVKTDYADKTAVAQAVRYRDGLGADFAIVTAPRFRPNAHTPARAHGVALLTGAQCVGMIGMLAAHQALSVERRKLEVTAA